MDKPLLFWATQEVAIFNALENTVQVQQKFKYYLENHVLKAGVNYIRGEHELLGGGNLTAITRCN